MSVVSWLFTEPGHNAKVSEIQVVVLVKQNIGGFDITMENTQRMKICKRAC